MFPLFLLLLRRDKRKLPKKVSTKSGLLNEDLIRAGCIIITKTDGTIEITCP